MERIAYYIAQLDVGPLPLAKDTTGTKLLDVINTALVIIGSVAVLIIVLAGIRYIISRGDPQSITKAKNTILYAVIGLIITMSAAGIVNFALNGLGK